MTDSPDIPDPAIAPFTDTKERLYVPGESLFGAVAMKMRERGWAVFPQERGNKRMPSVVDNRAIKIKPYFTVAPTLEETRRWSIQAINANAAIFMGPSSGGAICFDCDITDEFLAADVRTLAKEILGPTPFRRVGTSPKVALLYRVENLENMPPNRAHYFMEPDGTKSTQQIEVLSKGKSLTAFGHHHKTGRYFSWEKFIPTLHGPEELPVVSRAQIDEFIGTVAEIRAFWKSEHHYTTGEAFDGEMATLDGWVLPHDNASRSEDGKVIAREGWLQRFCFNLVRLNPALSADQAGAAWIVNDAKSMAAIEIAYRAASQEMRCTGRFELGPVLRGEVASRVRSSIDSLASGQIKNVGVRLIEGKAVASRKATVVAPVDPALWFIPPADKRALLDVSSSVAADPMKATARALVVDRAPISERVAREMKVALDVFFHRVHDDVRPRPDAHVLDGPAGAGKTTGMVGYIAKDPRTTRYDHLPVAERGGPIVILLPTYANIEELRERARKLGFDADRMTEKELRDQARSDGLYDAATVELEIEADKAIADHAGLRSEIYRGKIAAGCKMAERVKQLIDAGIPSSGMCKATLIDGREELCPYYSKCDAIAQRERMAAAHIVFLVHAFMTVTIPEELKTVRAVIADERIFTLFVHTTAFELSALSRPRKEPTLTKGELEEGMQPDDVVDRRNIAADMAIRALRENKAPAQVLADWRQGRITGLDLVKSAARVCGQASTTNAQIHPLMLDAEIAQIAAAPVGKWVREEARFWRLCADWIESHHQQITSYRLARSLNTPGRKPPRADRRVQLLQHLNDAGAMIEMVRISWLTAPNWSTAPVLLLDASADERIIERIFPDRQVVMHRIKADFNCRIVVIADKRMSTSSLVASADAGDEKKASAASAMERVRDLATHVSAIHASGRVVVASARKVRAQIGLAWTPPENVDGLHYGAERGLNFAEKHPAVLVIGRMELPGWIYDGLAAALVRDDEELTLLDPLGTGLGPDGNPLEAPVDEIKVTMRDGSDIGLVTAINPVGWLRIVQRQFREEGIIQAMCRVRPVFRSDTPTIYIAAQCVPEGLIVDAVISMDDMRAPYAPLLDANRVVGGVLDPGIAWFLRSDMATYQEYRAMFEALPAELKAQHSAVSYRIAGQECLRHAGVPGHHADPITVFRAAATTAGMEVEDVTLVRRAERIAPADVRPADALTIDRVDAIALEAAGIREAVERLTAANAFIPARGLYPLGPGAPERKLTSHALVHGIATPPKKRMLTLSQDDQDQHEKSAATSTR